MKIVYFGTPQIAVEPLEYLLSKEDIDVCGFVTQPDRPCGRGKKCTPPPVKVCAKDRCVYAFQTPSIRKDEELIAKLQELEPDFFITVAFGQILSQEVLDIPKYGTINLHASLLPEYRGANPLQRAIVEGKKKTGVTTMMTVLELDAGDMLLTHEIDISEDMTMIDLCKEVASCGGELLYRTITEFDSITPRKQDESKVTFANKYKKEDGIISWDDTAWNIHNKIRGFLPWPCAYSCYQGKPIKLLKSKVLAHTDAVTGEILKISKEGIEVATKEGIILIEEIQPQNKKAMKAYDWVNGAQLKVGSKLG